MSARERPLALAPARSKRAAQRRELAELRRALIEPRALEDRDLLTLLAYAVGGDGDPVVGLLEEARATVSVLSDAPAEGDEATVLLGLERRLAVALELYARATTDER